MEHKLRRPCWTIYTGARLIHKRFWIIAGHGNSETLNGKKYESTWRIAHRKCDFMEAFNRGARALEVGQSYSGWKQEGEESKLKENCVPGS